ncbi:MAG: hypothetical protein WD048_04195 [Chitinophagales bacterium]
MMVKGEQKQEIKLDLNYLKNNSGGNPSFLKEVIESYLKNEPVYISELQGKLKSRDSNGVAFYCHKIKANFSIIGAADATLLINEINQLDLLHINEKAIAQYIHSLQKLHMHIKNELSEELNKLKTN